MAGYDVMIVGGGPGGSTCAWALKQAGLNVLVIDKATFPRDKICAGWITPQVLQSLAMDVQAYASCRTFQPITSFRTSVLGRHDVLVRFDRPVSYGIRRCEFDHYLLQRSGAALMLGESIKSMERTNGGWVLNGQHEAPMLIGAGGHFCPVARKMRERHADSPPLVTAVEVEFPAPEETGGTPGDASPRLYFCSDATGYGWCVRKGEFLNIGIGLVDSRETNLRLPGLLEELRRQGVFPGEAPVRFHGHAYSLYDGARTPLIDDGVILIGDAAGLAYPQSGEGIRPAVESGIFAAQTILACAGDYAANRLQPYQDRIRTRFGRQRALAGNTLNFLPASWKSAMLGRLIANRWFARKVILERWFLHAHQPAVLL